MNCINDFNISSVRENSLRYRIFKRITQIAQWLSISSRKTCISYGMLSDYCKNVAAEYRIKVGDIEKLISNFGDKINYAVH